VPSLHVTDGPLAGRRIRVDAPLVVGRLDADLTIDDPLVSRRHAEIRIVERDLEVEDRGSLNGTWVNGERIAGSRRLAPGDVVQIGETSITVERDLVEEGGTVLAPAAGRRDAGEPPRHEPPLSVPPSPADGAPAVEPVAPVEPVKAPEHATPMQPVPRAEPVAAPEPATPVQPVAPAAPTGGVESGRGTVQPEPPPAPPAPDVGPDQLPPPGGAEDELRTLTALFADIVGSTSLGEKLAPDQVKALIGECVTRMCRATEQFGGVVQAYMGDGIAAFFGVPSAHEDDPERAARAALRIVHEVGKYAREVEAVWGISEFNARVGINTGEAAVGLVGAGDPQSVSLGDAANVAARLQSAAEPGSIVVGAATAKALLHTFALEPLGDVTVKGRLQPVSAWELVGAHTALQATPTTPLVGREHEIARLEQILHELGVGRGQILFLLGDAGIGKTRLLAELRRHAADVTWLEGHCLSYGGELVYAPFVEMLRGWIGAEEGEAELFVRTKLRAKLSLLPASQAAEILPYLGRLLSVTVDPDDERRLSSLPAQELAGAIRQAYSTWVTILAGHGPIVLAVEDLQWANPSTRELTADLLELAHSAPVLLVATLRIEPESEGWRLRAQVLADHPHRVVELPLAPLTDDHARELLAALPQSAALGTAELDQIVQGAEGNPLYLEELLNAFADGAGLARGHTWAPTVTGKRLLSPTLESLLLARIDRLPATARRLALIAAVVGRAFPLRVLEHVADTDDLDRDLASLLRADVIREQRRYPEPEYVFRHGLLREVCLSILPPPRRRELYGSVGAAYETWFATSLGDHLEVLAYYFARSDDLTKGLSYLEQAAERALALDGTRSAAEHWRRALKVAEKLGDQQAVERLLGQIAAFESAEQDADGKGAGASAAEATPPPE
jgi:class 3 adenylate cyclase